MGVELAQARPFLDSLFGNIAAGEFLLLYTLPERRSSWFTDVESACAALATPAYQNTNVYAGVCASPADMGAWNRCDKLNVSSLGCLWADIDVGSEGHAKKTYPPTIEDVVSLFASSFPVPSMIVSTGHGIHAYWLLKERFATSKATDNAAAAELSERWQGWLSEVMKKKGWALDSTFDLARVLRVPGTMNYKDKEHPLPVTLLDNAGTRYEWAKLSKKIPGSIHAESRTTATKPGGIGALRLDENRVLDADMFNVLRTRFKAKFTDSFERTKPLPGGDQSASAYDASLAMYGVIAGNDDQQIADLIIVSRRGAGQDLKLRQDYYSNTISSARAAVKKADGIDELINQAQSTSESQDALGITPEEAKRRVLDSLSTVLGVRVDRIVKYDVDPDPMFWMEVGGSRRVRIGTVDVIMEERKFKNKVMGMIGALLPDFKRSEWEKIAQLIVNSAEVAEGIVDGRFEDSTKSLVSEYLLATKIGEDADDAAALGMPFIKDDKVFISLESLKQWIYYTRHQDLKLQDLAQFLTNAGCRVRKHSFVMRSSGKQVGRRVWQVPSELIPGTG